MKNRKINIVFIAFILLWQLNGYAQNQADIQYRQMQSIFQDPPDEAKPWVFWYWMHAAVTKEGITTELEALKDIGIAGAYLMPIKDTLSPPLVNPPAQQLSPLWWDMVRHALKESKRLGLKIGMHVSDGFALAGGPWITPELSMQKITASQIQVAGNRTVDTLLPMPEHKEHFYKDIKVYAWPTLPGETINSYTQKPVVSSSTGQPVAFLAEKGNKQSFGTNDECWIQYSFEQPFTCRTINILSGNQHYQSQRMIVEVSNDGVHFTKQTRLETPRHGWQDWDEPYSHTIEPVTAKHFRLVYSKAGTEPGAEDLDAAKWKPSIKITGIELSAAPRIHQYQGKSGAVWRISRATTDAELDEAHCVAPNAIIDLTAFMQTDGTLKWKAPAGNWTIMRIGHTSTGHTNYTAGQGLGLECDKFNPAAVKLQFDNWFGHVFSKAGGELTKGVLEKFHVDSWECGSQNWSTTFAGEFKKRRGYDVRQYLPVMLGIPIESAAKSEQVLQDIRETIAELVNNVFYATLQPLAHQYGCRFSAESVAPTMVSDGILHYSNVDLPMGEFWLNSPTHDKPNDMLDAISGAHVYGKNIVQAESFTTVRMDWKEHPGMLKPLGDLNLALGVNKIFFHVMAHNPYPRQKPGVTLDGVGLYFQPNQTWWKASTTWMEYISRCQALLQLGRPVVDIAVFTGEDAPRRAILPDLLVPVLPGLFGDSLVQAEKLRLANIGQPLRSKPDGVNASANIADPVNWMFALRGYRYDSYNKDALLNLSTAKDGALHLQGGAKYKALVLPGAHRMSPGGNNLSKEVSDKIAQLIQQKVPVINNASSTSIAGAAHTGSWYEADFKALGIEPDFTATDYTNKATPLVAWTHREWNGTDIYFVSNQADHDRVLNLSFRIQGMQPEIWDPLTGKQQMLSHWDNTNNRTVFSHRFYSGQAMFIVFARQGIPASNPPEAKFDVLLQKQVLSNGWRVQFDPAFGGPTALQENFPIKSWTEHQNDSIRHYSGTAIYTFDNIRFKKPKANQQVVINIEGLHNIATIKVNSIDCGTIWTNPMQVNISGAIKSGKNSIEIAVTNTWHNRLIGDQLLPEKQRITWTTAPFRLANKPLAPAGITQAPTIYIYRK